MLIYNQIYNEDYLNFFRKIENNSIDLVLTDPPYGINYQNFYTQKKLDKLNGDEIEFSYVALGQILQSKLKTTGCAFIYTGWSTYPKHYLELTNLGLKVNEPLIIQKRGSKPSNLKSSWQTNSDWLLFITKENFKFKETQLLHNKKAGVIPNKGRKPVPEFKYRMPSAWFGNEFPFSTENPQTTKNWPIQHPTPKTIDIGKWLIQISTNENNLVVDPFCGSGSFLIAAKNLNRRYLGCDINSSFIELTNWRISNYNVFS